jgi:hypothetical protein
LTQILTQMLYVSRFVPRRDVSCEDIDTFVDAVGLYLHSGAGNGPDDLRQETITPNPLEMRQPCWPGGQIVGVTIADDVEAEPAAVAESLIAVGPSARTPGGGPREGDHLGSVRSCGE